MRLNKKATEFGMAFLAIIVVVIIFMSASYSLYSKINDVDKTLGDTQYKLLNTYDNAEKINFYIDEAAKRSGYKAIETLNDNGGVSSENCGVYFGATLLTNTETSCIPEDSDVTPYFENEFNSEFMSYISQFKTYNINNQFNYYIVDDVIRGISDSKVILPIDGEKIENNKPQTQTILGESSYLSSPAKSNLISSCFGYREAGGIASTYHAGLDFSNNPANNGDDNVFAVGNGKVVYSDKQKIDSNPNNCNCWGTVMIDHGNNIKTIYVHMDQINVNIGDLVKTGDKLGIAGGRSRSSRTAYAKHIHFEVVSDKIKAEEIDPVSSSKISYQCKYEGCNGFSSINPACFFDLTKMKISPSSKACTQINENSPTDANAVKKFCDIYTQKGIGLPTSTTIIQNVDNFKITGNAEKFGIQNVDQQLVNILKEAAKYLPQGYRVELVSGFRNTGVENSYHKTGKAADVFIYNNEGKQLSNIRSGPTFRIYEMYAQYAKKIQTEKYPNLNNNFKWGGYFVGGVANDEMHFDLGTGAGAAGSWENGLISPYKGVYDKGGEPSKGMGKIEEFKLPLIIQKNELAISTKNQNIIKLSNEYFNSLVKKYKLKSIVIAPKLNSYEDTLKQAYGYNLEELYYQASLEKLQTARNLILKYDGKDPYDDYTLNLLSNSLNHNIKTYNEDWKTLNSKYGGKGSTSGYKSLENFVYLTEKSKISYNSMKNVKKCSNIEILTKYGSYQTYKGLTTEINLNNGQNYYVHLSGNSYPSDNSKICQQEIIDALTNIKIELEKNIPTNINSNQISNINSQEINNKIRKIAVIGDSITADNIYVNELKKLINSNSISFDVYAKVGESTIWMYSQFTSNVKDKGYTDLIILGGINNVDNAETSLEKIYNEAKTNKIKVIALKLTPVTPNKYKIDYTKIRRVNDWIDSQKGKNIDFIIDTFSLLKNANNQLNKNYDSGDGLHPNEAGKKLIAKMIYDAVFSGNVQQNNGQTSQNEGLTCSGINAEQLKQNLATTKYKACVPYIDFIKKYAEKNDMKYSIALLTSVVYGESNCIESIDKGNGFGLMQVTGVWKKKFPNYKGNAEQQIESGMGILKYYSESTKKLNVNEIIKMKLALYGYNRGNNIDVVNLMKNNPGIDLKNAMTQACQKVYVNECWCGNGKNCKWACDGKGGKGGDMCTGLGLGSNYADKILKEYENICKTAGGSMDQTIATSMNMSQTSQTYNSIGEYSFTPAFENNFGFDLNIYNKIYKTLKILNEKYDSFENDGEKRKEFVLNITKYAKEIEPSLDWNSDIDIDEDKAYYNFAEQLYICSSSNDNNCYCEINIPKTIPKTSSFDMKSDSKTVLLIKNSNFESLDETNVKKMVFYPGLLGSEYDLKTYLSFSIDKIDTKNYNLKIVQSTGVGIGPTNTYDLKFSEPFYVFKNKDYIGFIKKGIIDTDYDKVILNKNKKICQVNKNTFKLGVNTKFPIPIEYADKSVGYEKQTIKFAYMFRDILPPNMIYDLININKIFSDNEIILNWKHNDIDQDLSKFVIFYSKEDLSSYNFKNLEQMSNEGDNVKQKEFLINDIVELKSIDLTKQNIEFSNFIKTNYNAIKDDDSQISIDIIPDKLYYLSENYEIYDEYVTKILTKDSGKYYFVIAAIDKSNNVKIKNDNEYSNNYNIFESKDTIAPATSPLPGFIFKVERNKENKIEVSFDNPATKNVDGSEIPSNEALTYNVYYAEKEMTPTNFKDNIAEIGELDLDPTKRWCFYVVPVDVSGNMQFNEFTKQFMDNSKGRFFEPKCIDPIN